MPERVGRADEVGELHAQDRLNRLAGYCEHLSGVRGGALRDLRKRHLEHPIGAVGAYRLALRVLGPGVGEFEAWAASPDCCWSRWPTLEGEAMRERVRVLQERPPA